MIKGIKKITCLGVFEDYTKPADMKEFGVKNLIYGWNYSGKTTISRLFAQLESKTLNPDLSGCLFNIETDDGPITETSFTQSNLTVRVFNEDFVRDNLNFTGQSFRPILLLGKESKEVQKKLDHYGDLTKRTQDRLKVFEKEIDDLETAFSEAKNVDQRAEALFGKEKAKRILKVLHYFSHANSIERLSGNNELIFDVEQAVSDLLSAIKDIDPLHWKALIQATSD